MSVISKDLFCISYLVQIFIYLFLFLIKGKHKLLFIQCCFQYRYLKILNYFNRYKKISKPFILQKMSNSEAIICIVISLIIGSFWSVVHYFVLSDFSIDKIADCNVKWSEKRKVSILVNIIFIILLYLLPIFIFFSTNYKLILIVSSSLFKLLII